MANGDRAKALKMLEDPDALMANETVQAIIAEGAKGSDLEVVEGKYAEPAAATGGGGGGGGGAKETRSGRRDGDNGAGAAGELIWFGLVCVNGLVHVGGGGWRPAKSAVPVCLFSCRRGCDHRQVKEKMYVPIAR